MSMDSEEIQRALDGATRDMMIYGTGAVFLTLGQNGHPKVTHVPFHELKVDGKPKTFLTQAEIKAGGWKPVGTDQILT